MLRQSRLLGSDGSSLRRSGLPTHKQLQLRAVLAAGKDKLKRSRHKNTKRLCTAAVLAARAVGTPDTPAPSRSPSAELGGAGLAADARFDFAVEGLFHMEVFVTFSGGMARKAAALTCASQHFTHKRLRLEQLSRHCRIYPDLASQKELDLVAAEYDARAYVLGWTHQSLLESRLKVLKRLGLRLAEDATKSACLREALAGEAKKHQAIHEKTVKAEGLAGRAKQLEKHIKELEKRKPQQQQQQLTEPSPATQKAVQAGLKARSREFRQDPWGSLSPIHVVPAGAEAASGKEQARPAGDQPSFTSKRPAVDSLGLEAAGQELSSCRVELAASRAEEKRLADQHLMYLQEAVQAVEGVLVHWADDNLPALPAQTQAGPNTAKAEFNSNCMTYDNAAATEHIFIRADGPEISMVQAKVQENAAAFVHGHNWPKGASEMAKAHIPMKLKMANRAFQRLILDEDSQVIHFKCRFLPPAQQKPGSGWGHAPSGPTSTPSHPPAAHDAADGAHRQSKAASSEPKTGHRPSQLADAEPSDLATGPAAQVASSTDGQSGDTLSPNLDSEAGAAPSAGAAHAASMTGLGDIVVGDGRALLAMIACLDAYLTHPATLRPLNTPARPDRHFMPGEAYDDNVPVRLKFVPAKGTQDPAVCVLGMGGKHVVQARQIDGRYKTFHLDDRQLGAWQHCCDAFLQREAGWHSVSPPGPSSLSQPAWRFRLPTLPGTGLLRATLHRIRGH
ncbi:hypothetical protein WJX84_008429 [Apatococcus fuscideae]|uniref:Uncharacterized protein n=1 Tax=Apatococcus fuscideae TaxID=2026836 RepID=A0AAW1T768_9CHLO